MFLKWIYNSFGTLFGVFVSYELEILEEEIRIFNRTERDIKNSFWVRFNRDCLWCHTEHWETVLDFWWDLFCPEYCDFTIHLIEDSYLFFTT